MKLYLVILSTAAFAAMTYGALADDHLYQATQHGLRLDSQPFTTNPAGHSGDLAPGQGSPFQGGDTQTPSTDNSTANLHANVKPRTPK